MRRHDITRVLGPKGDGGPLLAETNHPNDEFKVGKGGDVVVWRLVLGLVNKGWEFADAPFTFTPDMGDNLGPVVVDNANGLAQFENRAVTKGVYNYTIYLVNKTTKETANSDPSITNIAE
jgi:hypothetical protein